MKLRARLRKMVERVLGRFYEGPEPSDRYAEQVFAFRRFYPRATAEEWASFASNLASNAYRDGYVRGFEWKERRLDERSDDDPELIAARARHEWERAESERVRLALQAPDPLDGVSEEHKAALFDELGVRMDNAWRVVPLKRDDDP